MPAAGVEATVAWFEPRYWIARGAADRRSPRSRHHHSVRACRTALRAASLPARRTDGAAQRRSLSCGCGEARTRAGARTAADHAAARGRTARAAAGRGALRARGPDLPRPTSSPNTCPTRRRWRSASMPARWACDAWAAIGRCIRRFHDYGLCHADLNAHNILLRGDREVFLIDFDRCARRQPGMWRDANLARLRRSLDKLEDAPQPAPLRRRAVAVPAGRLASDAARGCTRCCCGWRCRFAMLRFCWRGWRNPALSRQPARARWRWAAAARTDRPLWLHAASVGEVQALARPAARAGAAAAGASHCCSRWAPPTGLPRARDCCIGDLPAARRCGLAPWDLPGVARRFLRVHRPRAAVFIETELWPNLLRGLRRGRHAAGAGQRARVGAIAAAATSASRDG